MAGDGSSPGPHLKPNDHSYTPRPPSPTSLKLSNLPAGGRGGSSYSWTEETQEYYTDENGGKQSRTITTHHRNPGGRDGYSGADGRRPTFPLFSGSDGHDGNASINIQNRNGATKSYLNRYHLVVKSFEVVDENNDGVNEPGEYLIVKNIIVHNQGVMPSPSGNLIKVVIRESPWLEPETSAPLDIPNSIPPSNQAIISGQLRAFIRHEQYPRKSGQQLLKKDTVKLLAYSERLKRAVPEFSGAVPIVIQYPLQLPYPAYIDCMTKADEMVMSWIVQNISSRGYGHGSDTGQATETRLIDLTRSFVLKSTAGRASHVVNDIENSRPKSEHRASESFTVASETKAFSTGSFRLELYLSDPHQPGKMREIVNYRLNIQVSEPYEYKKESQFLLVVNATTKNEAIIAMKNFVLSELHLGVDIWNISLVGSVIDDKMGESALSRYMGKSIIVSGNSCRFFGPDQRYNWDVIDPQEVLLLLMNHTGFLFCEVIDQAARQAFGEWSSMLRYPVWSEFDTSGTLVKHKDRHTFFQSLRCKADANRFNLKLKNQIELKKNYKILRRIFQGTTDRRLKRSGKAFVKKLSHQMPMRRFVVTTTKRPGEIQEPVEEQEERPTSFWGNIQQRKKDRRKRQQIRHNARSTGVVTIAEGLSRTVCCMVSHSPIVDDLNEMMPQQVMMMMAGLPFPRLSLLFWNIVQSMSWNVVGVEAFYRNIPDLEVSLGSSVRDDYDEGGGALIGYDICAAVLWAVERALDADVQQLCAQPYMRTFDTISRKNMHVHTQRVARFFNVIQDDSISASEEGVDLAVQALSSLQAALKSRSTFVEIRRKLPTNLCRRRKLRKGLSRHNKRALLFMAPPDKTRELEKRISDATKQRCKELKQDRKVARVEQSHIQQKLATTSNGFSSEYTDVGAEQLGSSYLDANEFEEYKAAHRELQHQRLSDAVHAREARSAMITKVYSVADYIPLAELR